MQYRDEHYVDLLEIFHGRQLRDQIVAQLRRLTALDHDDPDRCSAPQLRASRYYEAMLITVSELLDDLGDLPLRR
jgi:hypothetical protein